MPDQRENADKDTLRRKRSKNITFWGISLLVLALVVFFGFAFMSGVGATLWRPLPKWAFMVMFWALMSSVPTAAIGFILLLAGIIRIVQDRKLGK